jgi:preprotein translocase subunit SecG
MIFKKQPRLFFDAEKSPLWYTVIIMPEVRWLNLEYFFFKIYDFLGSVFGVGSGSNGFGYDTITHPGMGGFLGSGKGFFAWLSGTFGVLLTIIIILATIALVIMVFFVVYTRMRVHELDTEHKQKYNDHFIKPAPRVMVTQNPRWERIKQLFDSHNQNDWRVAIIDADTMLDELLISYNFPGENLGERLKNANNRVMPTVQSAWEAHKVRNRIAHEGANFSLSEREAQLVKKHYEFIFSDAGII